MTREELVTTAPGDWTPDHDGAFGALIVEALGRVRTLRWRLSGQAKQGAHWVAVWNRFHVAHTDLVHTGGLARDKGDLVLNASAWPVNDRSGRGKGRTAEQNTRVETW